jgi:uncharacterized protein YutE (UPF0331/DUF86 family)
MTDRHLVERKLRRIEEFLRELVTAEAPADFNSFSKNVIFKRFVERNIELAIEQMIDICKHLISALDLQEPETYADCFDKLGQFGILPDKDAETFKSMARYRNLLIHGYDGVDDTITFGIYKKRLNDFRIFINAVQDHINK